MKCNTSPLDTNCAKYIQRNMKYALPIFAYFSIYFAQVVYDVLMMRILNTIEYRENIAQNLRRVCYSSHKRWIVLIQAAKSCVWGGNQAGLWLSGCFKSTVNTLLTAIAIEKAYQQPIQSMYSKFERFKFDNRIIYLFIDFHTGHLSPSVIAIAGFWRKKTKTWSAASKPLRGT